MAIRRRKLARRAGVVLALLVLFGVAGPALWPDRPGHLSRANFDRVHDGMSYQEVLTILGPPTPDGIPCVIPPAGEPPTSGYWDGDTGECYVLFDRAGVVYEKGFERKPLVVTLRIWWSRALGRPAPF